MDLLRFLSRGTGENSTWEDLSNLGSEAPGRVLDFVLGCLCHFSIGNMGFVSLLIKTVLLYM